MKINATLTDRQCRHAESRMRTCAQAGGIKDADKIIVSAEKCDDASGRFFTQWSAFRGGRFNEIITAKDFSREEINAILKRLE